jgi:hypothetical protein
MSESTLSLNCFILGDDPGSVFPVKIERNDNVGILKDLIKMLAFLLSSTPKISTSSK